MSPIVVLRKRQKVDTLKKITLKNTGAQIINRSNETPSKSRLKPLSWMSPRVIIDDNEESTSNEMDSIEKRIKL